MRNPSTHSESMLEALSQTTDTRRESDGPHEAVDADGDDVRSNVDNLQEQVDGALPVGGVQFDEPMIKENLEELLLLLVTLHDGTHGKELLSDLSRLFETQLSPGTVYPCLHDLEDRDVLAMHAKVRTKEYSVADAEYVRASVEQTMVQHLAFGLLLYEFLPELRASER